MILHAAMHLHFTVTTHLCRTGEKELVIPYVCNFSISRLYEFRILQAI